jgi:hypothetical protein
MRGQASTFIFVVSSTFLRSFSIAQDSNGAAYTVLNRHDASSAIPFAVCLTFAAVDWLMGLDYHWFSTMWGCIFSRHGTEFDVRARVDRHCSAWSGYLQVDHEHYHIMGKLMLSFTIFWAYIGFQPIHARGIRTFPRRHLLRRNTASWVPGQFMVIGHFLCHSFFFQRSKRHRLFFAGWQSGSF